MDLELVSFLESQLDGMPAQGESRKAQKVRFVDEVTGEIELIGTDEPLSKTHLLKPLASLYGKGTGRASLDPNDETFTPLLMAIEEPILECFRKNPGLTDAKVSFALDRLCMSPEGEAGSDTLGRRIQLGVRLCLSLNDYSRQDLRLALRKVAKSVMRHTKEGGPRGYLLFIKEYLP